MSHMCISKDVVYISPSLDKWKYLCLIQLKNTLIYILHKRPIVHSCLSDIHPSSDISKLLPYLAPEFKGFIGVIDLAPTPLSVNPVSHI